MVTYVFDDANDEIRLYLDADLKRTIAFTPSDTPQLMLAGGELRIGVSSIPEYMDGWIDDVAIWDGALADAEVLDVFENGVAPLPPTAVPALPWPALPVTALLLLAARAGMRQR